MTTLSTTVERIQVKARDFDLARALLTLVAAPFFLLGWTAWQAYRVMSVICAWMWAAVVVGWQEASGRRRDGAG